MEVQAQGSAVLVVVAIEVVVQEVVELVPGQDVRAGVHHGTAGQVLVIGGILAPIQLIHHHLPNGVGSRGAALQVAVAAVGHTEVHGVGPQRRVRQRSSDRGVVQEGLLLHHGELVVAADAQVGRSHAHHRVVRDVGVLLGDDPHACHLLGPVVDGGVRPEALLVVVRNRVHGDLVALARRLLHRRVVGVLVRDEVGGLDVATVGVLAALEHLLVQLDVVVVDGVVEGDGDHHGHILGGQVAGNGGAVLRAEAVGQDAHGGIAGRGAVGIVVNICKGKTRNIRI